MTAFAFVMGAVTCFQAAGLQLYFLVSGILGAGTGWLLRQNWFRNFIRIRTLPSKESNEVYSRVIRGEMKLSEIKDAEGKVRYQAPRAVAKKPVNRRGFSGINVREGAAIPLHLKAPPTTTSPETVVGASSRPDRDVDYEEGAKGTMMEKLDYYRRNYRLAFMYRRTQASMDAFMKRNGFGNKGTEAQQKRKARAEQYEIERRRRFENRS
jgi:YidC/Oxa1 family membrane protein insertase